MNRSKETAFTTRIWGRVPAAFVGVIVAFGCGESIPPLIPTTIAISPIEATLVVGETVQLTAVIRDQNGTAMALQPTWSTDNPTVMSVSSASGLVTAMAAGGAMASVQYEALSASIPVTVLPPFELIASVQTPTDYHYHDDLQENACHYEMTVTGTGGRPADFALWGTGELTWVYVGGGTFTLELSVGDMVDRFGSDRIFSGQSQTVVRSATSASDFDLLYTLRATLPDQSSWSELVSIPCSG